MALYFEFDYYSNNPLIRMQGQSDLTGLDKFLKAVELHFPPQRPCGYLDMSQVDYMDSLLISKILETHLKMKHASQKLIIANPSSRVSSILIATGLDSVLNLEEIPLAGQEEYLNTLREPS